LPSKIPYRKEVSGNRTKLAAGRVLDRLDPLLCQQFRKLVLRSSHMRSEHVSYYLSTLSHRARTCCRRTCNVCRDGKALSGVLILASKRHMRSLTAMHFCNSAVAADGFSEDSILCCKIGVPLGISPNGRWYMT